MFKTFAVCNTNISCCHGVIYTVKINFNFDQTLQKLARTSIECDTVHNKLKYIFVN